MQGNTNDNNFEFPARLEMHDQGNMLLWTCFLTLNIAEMGFLRPVSQFHYHSIKCGWGGSSPAIKSTKQ